MVSTPRDEAADNLRVSNIVFFYYNYSMIFLIKKYGFYSSR